MKGLAAAIAVAGGLVASAPAAAQEPVIPEKPVTAVHVGSLTRGGSLFWDGAHVRSSRAQVQATSYFLQREFVAGDVDGPTDPCKVGTSPCWLYEFEVENAGELRVALDSSSRDACYAFELIDRFGVRRAFPVSCPFTRGVATPELFNVEARVQVAESETGLWQAKVVVGDVTDWAFRMRAALDVVSERPDPLAANLTPWPPYQFGFKAPLHPRPRQARERENELLTGPLSCAAEEITDHGADRCLRFSSGVHNVGAGPLHLLFDDDNKATQRTYRPLKENGDPDDTPLDYTDNEYIETGAGEGEYHDSHEHRHLENMTLTEFFEVRRSPGLPALASGRHLVQIGEGVKHGFCTFPNRISRWHRFDQDPHGTAVRQFDGGACDGAMALDRGWGDLYGWNVPGQYVEYTEVAEADGTMRPGFYLVRVTLDPDDHLLESDEGDNVGYAYIQVIDVAPGQDRVVICERGLGLSPWDPRSQAESEPFWWTIREASQAPRDGEC